MVRGKIFTKIIINLVAILGLLFFVPNIYSISITYSGSNVLFLRVMSLEENMSSGNMTLNGKDILLKDLGSKLQESSRESTMLIISYNPSTPTGDDTFKSAMNALVNVIKIKAENAGIKNIITIEEGNQGSPMLSYQVESKVVVTPAKTESNQDWITAGERRITRNYHDWVQRKIGEILQVINSAEGERRTELQKKFDMLRQEITPTNQIREYIESSDITSIETAPNLATPLGDRFGRAFEMPASKEQKLTINGGFEDNLKSWDVGHALDLSKMNWNCQIVYDEDKESNVVQFERMGSNNSRSSIGVSQDVFIDLSQYKEVKLRLDVCPMYQSLPGGGYVGGEYPIMVQIAFIDEQNNPYVWTYGFIYDGETEYKNVTKIDQFKWLTYTSPNLKEILPDSADEKRLSDMKQWGQPYFEYKPPVKPKYITRVLVFGSGWDFKSRADNMEFIFTPK